MRVPHVLVCGRSGSGKTTLVERLIREFRDRGISVGVLKHTSHPISGEPEGKDTWRFRRAGAVRSGIASGRELSMTATWDSPPGIDELLKYYAGVDLVLIEGYKRERRPKIEVTAGTGSSDLECVGDPHLLAVAGATPVDCGVPFFDRDDYREIADFIVREILEEDPSRRRIEERSTKG
ncbi:MAG: molybdopterin-guanine dinucleotide biosynthesis protein B [Ignavibacteriales bacterium]